MLAFWSDCYLPEVDEAQVQAAFATAPQTAFARHALLSGQAAGEQASPGRTVCSCYGVGENSINAAIRNGYHSAAALGKTLRCGTNCGSCIPELNALLARALLPEASN